MAFEMLLHYGLLVCNVGDEAISDIGVYFMRFICLCTV